MPRARTEVVTLASGKAITRLYDDESGELIKEDHSYGIADIAISWDFRDGHKTSETYVCKRRLVKRRRYEQARLAYPDMPAADPSMRDFGSELLQLAADERKQFAAAGRVHVADTANARNSDDFCLRMIDAGRQAAAQAWLEAREHSLGELSWKRSRALVAKLHRLGARAIHVCQIRAYPDGTENSGNLVVEMPNEPAKRKSLLKEIDRLAREQGYEGDMDDGQRYSYVKLD